MNLSDFLELTVTSGAILAAAAAGALMGGLVRGFSGFGGALVMAPVLSLLFAPAEAVAMVLAIEMAGYVQLLPQAARHVRWREVGPMVAVATLCVLPGVWVVTSIQPSLMRRAISGIVVALAVLLISGARLRRRPGLPTGLSVAALSGFLEGLAGTAGPPVLLYWYAGPDSAATNRFNVIGYAVVLDALALAVFGAHGVLTPETIARLLVLIPTSIIGTALGGVGFRRTNEHVQRRTGLALILVIGLFGLLY